MSQTVERTPSRLHVSRWVSEFSDALAAHDADRVASLFAEDSYWRDLIALTWNFKTLEGRGEIADMLRATLEATAPGNFTVLGDQRRPTASLPRGYRSKPRPAVAPRTFGSSRAKRGPS